VNPELIRFAADLEWLRARGVAVQRFNLSQQPQAFVENALAKQALDSGVENALPLVVVNGTAKSRGTYPSREQLAEWTGVASATSAATPGSKSGGCCGANVSNSASPKPKCCC
jgi:hypothetical protein